MTEKCRKTIYFDSACPLCSLEIDHYRNQEGADRLAFVDISRPEATPGDDLPREAALARFHVRGADGSLVAGAAAFVAVWEELPKWRWAARVARLPGVTPLLEIAYRAFLPMRPALAAIVRRRGRR